MDCKCTLSQSLVGDGCDICNPTLALEYAREEIESLRQHDIGVFRKGAEYAFKVTGGNEEMSVSDEEALRELEGKL